MKFFNVLSTCLLLVAVAEDNSDNTRTNCAVLIQRPADISTRLREANPIIARLQAISGTNERLRRVA